MARLRRNANPPSASDDPSQRLRAAWLYYGHGLTQQQVSARLNLSRATVIRLLDEAKRRGEVQIWIGEGDAEWVSLALQLEDAFGLDEAVVVAAADGADQIARSVGLALGRFLAEVVVDGMTIGVGWGRTLLASLASLRPVRHENTRVVSLVGGVIEARGGNPLEYTWRVASQLGSECYLFIAPAFVDSAETKRRLIEDCGLDKLFDLAANLDLTVVGVGDVGPNSSASAAAMLSDKEMAELIAAGCVGDVLCNFIDADGKCVAHPINDRVMSVELDTLARTKHVVLASGGAHRADAIRAAISRLHCNTLITDEAAARALLASAG